jgi:prepilin-type N-terminal cleavage/methylation domain-containing protein
MKSKLETASNSGFTLIEVIVSLVLVGIMAVVAGMGIVSASRAFIFSKDAAEISQKSQLAMSRLTKSIANWTSVAASPTDHTLTLIRNDTITGKTVTENYSYSNNTLSLTVGDETDVLCDGLTDFKLEYLRTDRGGDSFWSPGQSVAELNLVRVTMTQAGRSGINSSTFISRVVPLNTARGDIQSLQTKYGTTSCFVATAAYGDQDDPSVILLRQFRDRILGQSDMGRKFIVWYYQEGPALAGFISGHQSARWLVRVALAPVVGIVFLILYFPSGLILIPLMTLLLLRLGYTFFTKGFRGRFIKPKSMTGSILIGLIVTMVIMAVLGASMVSIFGSSNLGNVASMFQPRANYLAESGFAYAVKEYLRDDSETNIIANHNRTFTLANGDSFKTFIYPYWFKSRVKTGGAILVVDPVTTINGMDSFPSKFQDTETVSVNRWMRVGSSDYRNYTSATYNATNHTVTFGGLSTVSINAGQDVYPAAQVGAQTIYPEGLSSSSRKFYVSTTANSTALADFPKNRGVITIYITSGSTTYQGNYTIAYDAVVSDNTGAYFIGLHNIPSGTLKSIFANGHQIPANTMVVLQKHGEIKAKGIAGTEGGEFTAERMLNYDQSLVKIDAWKKTTLEKKGEALADGKTDLVGTSAFDSSVGALKVTGTENVTSFSQQNTAGSSVTEYVSGINVPQLNTAWTNSGNTLSYDLQIKMRFSAGDENNGGTGPSTKTPGSYMPGIAFRFSGTTTTDTLKYYGLSIMRGIQGSDVSTSPARDRDGISDNIFQAWGSNSGATAPSTSQIACLRRTNSDFQWTTWSSTPPKDGRPYIVLWQRDVVTTSGWSSDTKALMDWLAYKEACTEETRMLFLYRNGTGYTAPPTGWAEGWYDGKIGAATPAQTLAAIRLVDQSNILATTVKEGVTILGAPAADYVWNSVTPANSRVGTVRDPSNGLPVAPMSVTTAAGRTYANRPVAYIFPGVIGTSPVTYETGAQPAAVLHNFLKNNNYRIYPKEWITIMVRLFEIKGDFDCDGARDDKVNVLQVYYADQDGLPPPSGQAYGDYKSIYRRAEPRGTIRWPEDGNYLTTTVWNEKVTVSNTSNFTSQVVEVASSWGWGNYIKKLVERNQDSAVYSNADEKDWPTVYTDWYKSPDSGTLSTFQVGLHAMGIDAPNDQAFFDDFAINIYEKTGTGLLPGLRSE